MAADEARHAARALRLRPSDRVILLDGCGVRAHAVIEDAQLGRQRDSVVCRVVSTERLAPPVHRVRLCVAPPRGKEMARIVRQAVELGVWRVSPVRCEFSVAVPASKAAGDHALAEAVAAIKQSGNAFLPALDPVRPFAQVVADCAPPGYFGDAPGAAGGTPKRADLPPGDVLLWVGPEGGFSPVERCELVARGFWPVTLGRWTLRVGTAVAGLLGWLTGTLDDHSGIEDT